MTSRSLAMIRQRAVLMLAMSLLSGCAVDVVSPQDPTDFIPDRSAAMQVGGMGRAAVHGALGTPQISSIDWGFDLFRADTEQTDVVVALTPWPIPFARIKDQLQRYTLVAYDAQDRATAVASGVFRRPSVWRNVSPIAADFPALHLRAGDLMFFVDPEGAREVNLLAAPASRDAFLQRAARSTGCTAVLGCGDHGCGDQLAVDAGPARRLPMRNAHVYWFREGERAAWLQDIEPHGRDPRLPWLETLVAIQLAPGEHVLEFSAKHVGGSSVLQFACRPGDVSYLVVDATDNGSFMKRSLIDWHIEGTNTMPPRFGRRPLVLIDDGQWYVTPSR